MGDQLPAFGDLAPSGSPEGWTIPAGYTFAGFGICQACRQQLAWTITKANRRAPLDRDGRSHFATCPQADLFRRRRPSHKRKRVHR